ncbi:MAG: ferredoxin family protein [Candidatus Omnitrophica bacterium]|nr:ferredoxin family protein [Candidatus Omnitrophota bacterium]
MDKNDNSVKILEQFAKWKGIPRQEIDWHPIIDENKCTGCGICFTTCGRNVFDYDKNRKKSVVARPFQCMVGCTSCQVWCIFDAISFPDKKVVRDFIKEKKLLVQARNEVEKKLSEMNKKIVR